VTAADRWKLWIAQGLGSGRVPRAPGTAGSVVGIAWTAVLLLPQSWTVLIAGALLGSAASVWLCGEAERILGRRDPGSVVLDEIIALPWCFAAWIALEFHRTGHLPRPAELVTDGGWLVTLGVFAAFRFFDVLKPPPVRQSQALPGGWGVTVDDLLAAVYVNLVTAPVLVWWGSGARGN
jgi:phosphatidylglycerophosphatase A